MGRGPALFLGRGPALSVGGCRPLNLPRWGLEGGSTPPHKEQNEPSWSQGLAAHIHSGGGGGGGPPIRPPIGPPHRQYLRVWKAIRGPADPRWDLPSDPPSDPPGGPGKNGHHYEAECYSEVNVGHTIELLLREGALVAGPPMSRQMRSKQYSKGSSMNINGTMQSDIRKPWTFKCRAGS